MITRINPQPLHKNPAFTQAAIVDPSAKQIHVGVQNAVTRNGDIVGDDIVSQTVQAMENIVAALDACRASLKDVFKMTIYIVQGQSANEAFAATRQFEELRNHPPTICVAVVAGLTHPDFLIEIDAVAAIE